MIFATALLIFMSYWHIRDISDIEYDKDADIPFKSLFWTAANLIVVTAICVGFGKPYSVFYGSLFAFACLCTCAVAVPSHYDWTEKSLGLLVMLILVGEYFHRGLTNRDRREDYHF
jgi:hypothetical protein